MCSPTTTAGSGTLDPTTLTMTQPTHGATTLNADYSITYTPNAGYAGKDRFTYRVCDTPTAVSPPWSP